MIHYHGGPITPLPVAAAVWTRRHGFVSFARPEQVTLAGEVCQSFAIDNGAFSHWQQGRGVIDLDAYWAFVAEWCRHPGFDWCLVPDVIEGDDRANDDMLSRWHDRSSSLRGIILPLSVPVWHLHESIKRLEKLCWTYPRVALGSSGQWTQVGTAAWWQRIGEALDAICDADGRPPCKLHGLRMLNPTVFSQLPLASADSTNIARNHNRVAYAITPAMRALVLVDRVESHASAPRWSRTFGHQENLDLVG